MKKFQHKNFVCAAVLLAVALFFLPCNIKTISEKDIKTISEKGTNWPMFMHDLQNTGYSFSAAPDSPHLLWVYNTKQRLFGSPIVHNDTLYQVGRGVLFALNAETGENIWSLRLPVIGSTPVVSNESLYVGTCNGIAALNAETGESIWETQIAGFECDPWNDDFSNFIASSPKVTNTGVIMCTHRNITASYGYPDPEGINRVVCVNAKTGTLIWQYQLDDRAGYSPAIINGKVFINSTQLIVLDEKTGKCLWSFPDAKGLYTTSPAVNHKSVLTISSDHGSVHHVSIDTQNLLWKYELDSPVISTPAMHDKTVIVITSEEMIFALNKKTGDVLWKREVQKESDFSPTENLKNAVANLTSSPAIADNKIYIGLRSGEVLCLHLTTGQTVWQYKTEGSIIASPAIADEKVFISSTDGKIYCFGIDPETYFYKAEQYNNLGDKEKANEFYIRAKNYYQSKGNVEMFKKCEDKMEKGVLHRIEWYWWIVIVVVCFGVFLFYLKNLKG